MPSGARFLVGPSSDTEYVNDVMDVSKQQGTGGFTSLTETILLGLGWVYKRNIEAIQQCKMMKATAFVLTVIPEISQFSNKCLDQREPKELG